MDDTLEDAKLAAKQLVISEESISTYRLMDELLSKVPHIPAKLSGEKHSWINPMIAMYRKNPEIYKTIVQWANDKRVIKGYTPLIEEKSKFERNPYQADIMSVIRERLGRAVRVENSRRAERDELKGIPRQQFEKETTRKWSERRAKVLAAAREAKGSRLTKVEMQELLRTFWATIDAELEAAELDPLNAALKFDPYA